MVMKGGLFLQINQCFGCKTFPCTDVNKDVYILPDVALEAENIRAILISEAAPPDPDYYYYAKGDPSYQQTTVTAFNDAGIKVTMIKDLLEMGVYLTSAVKCGKTGYGLKTNTIKECSFILEEEIAIFPNVKVFLLMGDVAIKAINYISLRESGKRVIPAGVTYKIRGQTYYFRGKRAFPSYLQVGPSFNIEKSKRRMIAEDIAAAMHLMA
jgi:uracil-DNA glycosylase